MAEIAEMLDMGDRAMVIEGDNVLELRPGGTATWYVFVPQRSSWTVDGVESENVGDSQLVVSLERDGFPRYEIASPNVTRTTAAFPLPEEAIGPAKIVVTATEANDEGGADGAWRLLNPRLRHRVVHLDDESRRSIEAEGDPPSHPNLVVYVADALRRDHVGAYGGQEGLTPNIDMLASESVVFDRAVAQSPWTRPSVVSLLTGLEPQFHGVVDRPDSLPDDALTIAEMLSAAGYFTAAVISNGNIGAEFGLAQGFDLFSPPGKGRNSSERTTERTIEVLADENLVEPFFLYIHNLDPHHPYDIHGTEFEELIGTRPDPYFGGQEFLAHVKGGAVTPTAQQREATSALYKAEVAYMDREFGKILDELRRRDLYEDSLVVFLSDHGEEFWDHSKWGHGETFYDEVIEVPLIIKSPRPRSPGRRKDLVQHIDLTQTLLEYASLPVIEGSHGRSLRPVIDGSSSLNENRPRQVLSHLALGERNGVALTEISWRFALRGRELDNVELFHLETDPSEGNNLSDLNPITIEYFRRSLGYLEDSRASRIRSQEIEIDPELNEQLKAIGYIQ
jgi:arylsulfatase A-like enzyme